MILMQDMRHDGMYVPIRYYTHLDGRNVILAGTFHNGEKSFYQGIQSILSTCNMVIYEQPHARDAQTIRQIHEAWSERLHDADCDEAFLAAIFLSSMPPQFMRDYNLCDEAHSFDYTQPHWISGDGNLGKGTQDAALPSETWDRVMDNIRSMDAELKQTKVALAKIFLEKVKENLASMLDYLTFTNFHEDEIQENVLQSTVAGPRDEMAFDVFDRIVRTSNPSRMGIKFGSGHIPHMDQLLRQRGYRCTTAKWLRVLTINNTSALEEK